jgi:hypothetical protein
LPPSLLLLPLLLVTPAAAVPSSVGVAALLPLLPVADLVVDDQVATYSSTARGSRRARTSLLTPAVGCCSAPSLAAAAATRVEQGPLLLLLLPPLLLLVVV